MKVLRIFTLVVAAIITGCASERVVTDNTAFFVDAYSPRGSISVVSGEASVNTSLEFATYKRKFESRLSMV